MEPVSIQIRNVPRIDALKLQKRDPDIAMTSPPEGTDLAQYEPATLIISLGIAGIGALAAWLLKDRKLRVVDEEITLQLAGGDKVTRHIHFELNESVATEKSVEALKTYLEGIASGG
jgi:hypothetical protein